MRNVMIDLETLGSRPGCIILSIGAVAFDVEHGIGPHMYCVVNTASCEKRYGLHRDPATEQWWRGQTEEARAVLREAEASKIGLADALTQLTTFFKPYDPWKVRVWSQGIDFDLGILAHCYRCVDREPPWKFFNAMDHRTLRNLMGAKKRIARHNAMEDAYQQSLEAIELLRQIGDIKNAAKESRNAGGNAQGEIRGEGFA